MRVIGFIPVPEIATMVVAWAQALVNEDEEVGLLCQEVRYEGRTAQAVT